MIKSAKLILFACVVLLVIAYARTKPLQDFVEYWTAAHQFVAGRNPYSFGESLQLENALGWSKPLPIVALNPPWMLPLIAPLGLAKSYAASWIVWVSVLAFLVWWSTKLLLELYAGGRRLFPAETASSERVLAFTFYPTLLCLGSAQITPIVLLGVAGFLWFITRERYWRAGTCLALSAIKPQLVYLLWLALLLWCWRRKTWAAVLSLAAAMGFLLGIAVLVRPSIVADYWHFAGSGYAWIWPSAAGAILRYPFNSIRSYPLQFLGPVLGTVWFFCYWVKRAPKWDWKKQTPLLVSVSVLTAAYGWTLDQVLLLVPVIAIASSYTALQGSVPRGIVWVYTTLNVALILGSLEGPAVPYVLAPLATTVVLFRVFRAERADRGLAQNSVGVTT